MKVLLAAAASLLLCLSGTAMAQAPQDPAGAYKACMVGNAVIALLQDGYEGADAGVRAMALCDYLAPTVPDPIAVEDAFIDLWDNRLVDLLIPEAE